MPSNKTITPQNAWGGREGGGGAKGAALGDGFQPKLHRNISGLVQTSPPGDQPSAKPACICHRSGLKYRILRRCPRSCPHPALLSKQLHAQLLCGTRCLCKGLVDTPTPKGNDLVRGHLLPHAAPPLAAPVLLQPQSGHISQGGAEPSADLLQVQRSKYLHKPGLLVCFLPFFWRGRRGGDTKPEYSPLLPLLRNGRVYQRNPIFPQPPTQLLRPIALARRYFAKPPKVIPSSKG